MKNVEVVANLSEAKLHLILDMKYTFSTEDRTQALHLNMIFT